MFQKLLLVSILSIGIQAQAAFFVSPQTALNDAQLATQTAATLDLNRVNAELTKARANKDQKTISVITEQMTRYSDAQRDIETLKAELKDWQGSVTKRDEQESAQMDAADATESKFGRIWHRARAAGYWVTEKGEEVGTKEKAIKLERTARKLFNATASLQAIITPAQ